MFLDVRDVHRIQHLFPMGAVGVGDLRRMTLGKRLPEYSGICAAVRMRVLLLPWSYVL